MNSQDVSVEIRLIDKAGSKTKAFADVTLPLGTDGIVTLSGFSVVQNDGASPRMLAPARKFGDRFIPTVALIGKVRAAVEEAVLAEYHRAVSRQNGSGDAH